MARPKKPPEQRLDEVITIPVTAEQKRLITETGGAVSPAGYTSWCRELLVQAARKAHGKTKRGSKAP